MASRLTRARASALPPSNQSVDIDCNLPFQLEVGEPWPTVLTKLEQYGWTYRAGSGIVNEYYTAPHVEQDTSLQSLELVKTL